MFVRRKGPPQKKAQMRQQQELEEEMLGVLGSGGAAGEQGRQGTSPQNPQGMGDQLQPKAERFLGGCDDEVGVSDEGLCSAGGEAAPFPHCSFPSTPMFGWCFGGRVFVREV